MDKKRRKKKINKTVSVIASTLSTKLRTFRSSLFRTRYSAFVFPRSCKSSAGRSSSSDLSTLIWLFGCRCATTDFASCVTRCGPRSWLRNALSVGLTCDITNRILLYLTRTYMHNTCSGFISRSREKLEACFFFSFAVSPVFFSLARHRTSSGA